MHQPRKPIESPILIIISLWFFAGSYFFSRSLCLDCGLLDDDMIGMTLSTIILGMVGSTFFYWGVSKGIAYIRKKKLIEDLSRSGQSIETVIVMKRVLSGNKRGPRGYEYLSKSRDSEKIYGSDMIRWDLHHPGQRVTVWSDITSPDRYWVDLESVRDETAESRAFLEAYLDTRGRGFFDELAHIYDDKPGWARQMKFFLVPIRYILEKTGILKKLEMVKTQYEAQMKENSESGKR